MNRRSLLATTAASVVMSAVRSRAQASPAAAQPDGLNPPGIRVAGIRMVPVVGGKYKVWTKKIGSGPIKLLVLHGGPGVPAATPASLRRPKFGQNASGWR
jgi:proline iminopeptidase